MKYLICWQVSKHIFSTAETEQYSLH